MKLDITPANDNVDYYTQCTAVLVSPGYPPRIVTVQFETAKVAARYRRSMIQRQRLARAVARAARRAAAAAA